MAIGKNTFKNLKKKNSLTRTKILDTTLDVYMSYQFLKHFCCFGSVFISILLIIFCYSFLFPVILNSQLKAMVHRKGKIPTGSEGKQCANYSGLEYDIKGLREGYPSKRIVPESRLP